MASDQRAQERHSPAVGWFELFYDLVVVAAVTLTNDTFLEEPSWVSARTAVFGIFALSWVWLLTMLFNNLFPGQDLIRRALMLAQMAAVVAAALAIDSPDGLETGTAFAAYGVALLIVVLLIASDRLVARPGRAPAPLNPGVLVPLLIAGGLCLLGPWLTPIPSYVLLPIVLAVSIIPILGFQYRRWQAAGLLRLDHMSERLGLFILIILGEGFAQLVAELHRLGFIPRAGLYALTFLVSFALWWIYFDGTFSERTELGRVRWRLSLLGHLLLVFGMAGTLDILVLLTAGEELDFGPRVLRYFCGCVALVLVAFALLRTTAKGRLQFPGWLHLASAAALMLVAFAFIDEGVADLPWVAFMCASAIIVNGVVSAWHDHSDSPGGARARFAAVLRGAVD